MPWKEGFSPKIIQTYNICINLDNVLVSVVKTAGNEVNEAKILNLSVMLWLVEST